MKGKLIKMVEGYTLSLTGDIDDLYALTNEELAKDHNLQKLSLKNCQAIENGYDLDELAEEYASGKSSSDVFKEAHKRDFIAGAKAILEIIGDKKFSEEDMRKAYQKGEEDSYTQGGLTKQKEDNYIQSLQQTEWDVQIVMNSWFKNGYDGKIVDTHPKLDSDSNLILKRI